HDCTVRRSTPAHRFHVANVARNLWRNQCSHHRALPLQPSHCSQFRPARLAIALQQSRKSNFGLHPAVGNTSGQSFDFAFKLLRECISFAGTGISRSLYALGVQLRSGLCETFTTASANLMSFQYTYMASCSRNPVIKKNSNHSFSCASHAPKNFSKSAFS